MKIIKGDFSDKNKKQKNSIEKKNESIPVIEGGEENYSGMLIDLIKPYLSTHPTSIELEEKVQLGVLAWNLSISKELGLPGYDASLNSAAKEAGLDKKQMDIVKKIAEDKLKRYSGMGIFIQDYKLEREPNDLMKVIVDCVSLTDMANEYRDIDDEDFEDDEDFGEDDFDEDDFGYEYDEGALDRTAISVNHKPALLEWAKKINIIPDSGENTIYLIDEYETEKQSYDWLKKNFQKIMTNELTDITDQKRKWPKMNYETFCDFFEVKFHNMVWDFEKRPIKKY